MSFIQSFTWPERCYGALLSLYPAEFRVRFGRELKQIFRDCCRDAARERGLGLIALWLRTICDLGISIPRERARALIYAGDFTTLTAGLVDSIVIGSIIAFHLFVAGSGVASYIGGWSATPADFLTLATLAGGVLGGVGVVCSLILSRFRRVHYRFIELP